MCVPPTLRFYGVGGVASCTITSTVISAPMDDALSKIYASVWFFMIDAVACTAELLPFETETEASSFRSSK